MRMCNLCVQSYKNPVVHVQYVRIILMRKIESRALYAVPRIRIKS